MAELFIGQVEKITGVKAHILRYWEEHVPLIAPHKDQFGRRIYSVRDVELLLRLKYLIETKKYTLEGACQQLVKEQTTTETDNTRAALAQVQGELLSLYLSLQKE